MFQSNFCHSCFRAFYTTIDQSYIPTTFVLENVSITFINVCNTGLEVDYTHYFHSPALQGTQAHTYVQHHTQYTV